MMRKYTAEQKVQLLNNLDLETSHRVQRFEVWLLDHLTNFRVRQEGLIFHIPKSLRNMTMHDFAKYNGDIQKAVQGLLTDSYAQVEPIDKPTRKRKWIESQEQDAESAGGKVVSAEEGTKPFKNARMTTATPKKPAPNSSGAVRGRVPATMKTPSQLRTQRVASVTTPSPHKPMAPRLFPFPGSRPTSPTKSKLPFASPSKPRAPLPSTSHFNPVIPAASTALFPRWPRRDESMLSVNGSPLANPLSLDLTGWLSRHRELDDDEPESLRGKGAGTLGRKRTPSIIVRSVSSSSQPGGGPSHSRATSAQNKPGKGAIMSKESALGTKIPASPADTSSLPVAALVSVPTADGHLLEFDPFTTSPAEIDALEGISSSAKKKAKEDMRGLVKQALERWKIE